MTIPLSLNHETVIQKSGIAYEVIKVRTFIHSGNARLSYTCKRPRGKRTYIIIGYEDGTFSSAV